jgi:hypothetical protein
MRSSAGIVWSKAYTCARSALLELTAAERAELEGSAQAVRELIAGLPA